MGIFGPDPETGVPTVKKGSIFGGTAGSSLPSDIARPSSILGGPGTDKDFAKVQELQNLADATGADKPEVDSPGLFMRAADLLSRGEYAAGALGEEAFTDSGHGLGEGLKRAGTELFSGIGGLHGQKQSITQLLEKHGVEKGVSLSDIFPEIYNETGEGAALQKGGMLDPSARGIGGFALGSLVDPLTWVTAGAGKLLTSGGKALSRAGFAKLGAEIGAALPEVEGAVSAGSLYAGAAKAVSSGGSRLLDLKKMAPEARALTDEILKKNAFKFAVQSEVPAMAADLEKAGIAVGSPIYGEIRNAVRKLAENKILAAAATDPSLLDRGGIKFMGRTIPGSPEVATALSALPAKAIAAAGKTPFGPAVMAATGATQKAMDVLGRTFSRDFLIRNLPGARAVKQAFLNQSRALISDVYSSIANSAVAALAKDEPAFQRVVRGLYRGDYEKTLEGPELEAAHAMREIMDGWALKESKLGLLKINRARLDEIDQEIKDIHESLTPKPNKNTIRQLDAQIAEIQKRAPLKYYEKKLLRSLDEVRYYKRRKWDIVEEGAPATSKSTKAVYYAYRRKEVLPSEYAAWDRELQAVVEEKRKLTAGPTQDEISRANYKIAELEKEAKGFDGGPSAPRENYTPGFYENSPDEMARVVSAFKRRQINFASVGKHAESKVFENPDEAIRISTALHELDPRIPILRPIWDPVELLRRRGEAHAHAVAMDGYYNAIKAVSKQNPEMGMRLADAAANASTRVDASEWEAITESFATKTKMPQKVFESLGDDAKREYLTQLALRAKTPGEVVRLFDQHGWKNIPKLASLEGTIAEDGTPFVRMSGIPALADVEIPKSWADDLAQMNEKVLHGTEVRGVLKTYDKFQNAMKTFVTVPFPSFHFRNGYSNVSMTLSDGILATLDPRRHYDAVALLNGEKGAMRTALGETHSYDEIRGYLHDLDLTVHGRDVLEYTGAGASPASRVARGAAGVFNAPAKVAGKIETEARTLLFMDYLRRGLTPEAAADRVKNFLVDYNNLSRSEREIFRRVFPFYTFFRRNVGLQLENLAKRPGMTAVQLRLFHDRANEQGALSVMDGPNMRMRLNSDGKTITVLSGVDLPIKQIDQVWRGSFKKTMRGFLSMMGPLPKGLIEYPLGVSTYSGRPMDRRESASIGRLIEFVNPPQATKNWLGYRKDVDDNGKPTYTFDGEKFYPLFLSWAQSRLVTSSDREFRLMAEDPGFAPLALDIMTGLSKKSIDMSAARRKQILQRTDQLRESLVRRGAMKKFETAYTPKAK